MPPSRRRLSRRRQEEDRGRHRQSRSDPRTCLLLFDAGPRRRGRRRRRAAHLQGAVGSVGPGLRHGAVKADRRTGRQDQARGLRAARHPIVAIGTRKTPRASSGSCRATARPAADTRSPHRAGGGHRPSLVSCCGPSRCMVSASDRVHLVQGFSLHLAASLVRFRELSVIDRRRPAVVHCRRRKLRRNIASKRRRIRPVPNQHGHGAARRDERHLHLERKHPARRWAIGSKPSSASSAGLRPR